MLVQVNISGEASKSGISSGDVGEFVDFVDSFDNLELVGLMFMPNINQDKSSHIKEIIDSVALFESMKSKKRLELLIRIHKNFFSYNRED